MFCDDLLADKYLVRIYDGLDKVFARIRRAQKFVLSKEFAVAADGLVENIPELHKIIKYCRLPYPVTWIEWLHDDRPHWDQNGPYEARPVDPSRHQLAPQRIGLLLEQQGDFAGCWKAHLFWVSKEKPHGAFETQFNGSLGAILIDTRKILNLVGRDPLLDALDSHVHADFGAKFLHMVYRKSPEAAERLMEYIVEDWGGEVRFMVAMLGLLNTRNVVHFNFMDKTTHNVKRARQKKPPLFSHTLLKIRPQMLTRWSGPGTGGHAELKLHFVRGHFKHRKTGLFYWSWHARGNKKYGVIEKDYEVT